MNRKPPYDNEAEKSVIGSMLLDNQTIELIIDVINTEDFYLEYHKKIFQVIINNYKKTPIDLITIKGILGEEEIKKVGGITYIADLVDNIPSSANIVYYAEIVKDFALRRRLLESAYEITEMAHGKDDINEIIEKSQKAVLAINPLSKEDVIKSAREVAKTTFEQIASRHEKGGLVGLTTGLTDLDENTGGLHDGELIIIAGRPGMGKSALALNIAHHAGIIGKASLIFSIEMPNETLMIRILASMTKIESRQIRKGFLKEGDWPKMVNAVSEVGGMPIFFDDTPLITPLELRIRARKAKKDHDIKLIVLDYLQIMTPSIKGERREREIADISQTLKSIARELKIPVIGVSQLNRAVDSRPDKRPLMSDLRESGAIEQDADVIAFIYRDEVYHKEDENPEKGIAEINIAKQRNGPIGTIKTVFSDKYQKFDNITHYKERTNYGYKNE